MATNNDIPDTDDEAIKHLWNLVRSQRLTKTGSSTPQEHEETCNQAVDPPSESSDTVSECTTSEDGEPIWEKWERELLIPKDDDPLIPSDDQVKAAWKQGWTTWSTLVATIEQLPQSEWPVTKLDPSIMLHTVPPLPPFVPKSGKLRGRPTWRVSDTQSRTKEVSGADRHLWLKRTKPIPCHISQQSDFFHYGKTFEASAMDSGTVPKALTILTLCWSYILSVRLLELQRRQVRFTKHRLQPRRTRRRCAPGDVTVDLSAPASPGLVRWLCAVLAPTLGWTMDVADNFPPWAAFCSGSSQFVIISNQPVSSSDDVAPSSSEALAYLIEFVELYGLGPEQSRDDDPQGLLSPYTAGFLAALALPFCEWDDFEPQLPVACLERPVASGPTGGMRRDIEQYYNDMLYYMTLSVDHFAVGSMIWSVFWQPGIQCNLVSPWLGSILDAIRPLLDDRDLSRLAKVFMLRRPKVAFMWLGIFLLGDATVLDRIERYLSQLEERRFHGSLGVADLTVASWTGSIQSFWDEKESTAAAADNWSEVSRADVLRRRHLLRLQDDRWSLFSWEPFGVITRSNIEPELVELFETRYMRVYVHWTWLVLRNPRIERGFRYDTGRLAETIQRDQEPFPSKPMKQRTSRLAPSKKATMSMLFHSSTDYHYDMSLDIACIPGLDKDHPWLDNWRLN
ncbi:hypothetical protein F5Y18DRAFT_279046 [Xylariaceae sp. FL1019]|nr:hypothetical protein F5Y18DRAFT_279046 [Xylariaceae sp. FL1019]